MEKPKKQSRTKTIKADAVEITSLPPGGMSPTLFDRDIKYLKIKDVKKAYSKLIQDFCKGKIDNESSRTLVYMFSGYLQLIKDWELEKRIIELEERLDNEKL